MVIVSKPNNDRHFLSFSRKLFLSVISLFLVFAACFIAYQYQREKEYKVELLDMQLQDYNDRLHQELRYLPDSLWTSMLDSYISKHVNKELRVTVVDLHGNVLFDSSQNDSHELDNHIKRPEVQKALKDGKGYDLRRISETTGKTYFYSATAYEGCIIRSALPYNVNLMNNLAADPHYIWFTVIVSLLLISVFYKFTSKLGSAINHLREFAKRADKNEPIDMDIQAAFPHNELGEISQHIIQIYKRLRETKEALYIEREKLITHLQTSREGLGVFNRDKKEILVNNLFTQYGNLISDSNLQTTEEIFSICEFQKITDFINKAQKRPSYNEERRMSVHINKNGRTFIVECIIFQDLSFEISINDITQEEEQVRLKRQLTQNIAHELKTPVSSIQGYLETIVNNENIAPEKMQVFLERCYAQSNRLSRLLRDISVLTRMDEAANMIDMAVGKQDPLHISRIKTSFPDGMDQHCGITAVSGIDQKKSVPGIDQMYTNPAVSYIINISEHTKRLHITLCLLRPVFGHRILFKFCSFCKIVFIIFNNAHDNLPVPRLPYFISSRT